MDVPFVFVEDEEEGSTTSADDVNSLHSAEPGIDHGSSGDNQLTPTGKTHVEQMIHFFHHGMDRDVKFIFTQDNHSVIMAHKSILCARSPYFARFFSNDKEMVISDDSTPEDFKLFLEHVYAGHAVVDVKDAFPLLRLSAIFEVLDIYAQCTELLKKGITDKNALLILELSGKYGNKNLNDKALDYIIKHASEIVHLSDFLKLSKNGLKRVMGSDQLVGLSELAAYEAITRWGVAEMIRQGISKTEAGMRSVLEDVVQLIRFPFMTKNDFYLKVLQGDMRILTTDEKDEMRDYFNVDKGDRKLIKLRIFNGKPRTRPVLTGFPRTGGVVTTGGKDRIVLSDLFENRNQSGNQSWNSFTWDRPLKA